MNDDSLTVFLVEVTGSELPKEISEMRHYHCSEYEFPPVCIVS